MNDKSINQYREFLKDNIRKEIDFSQTDQRKSYPAPPVQKEYSSDQKIIHLPEKKDWKSIKDVSLCTAFQNRQSIRQYTEDSLKSDELAFLLWATQGVRQVIGEGHAFRTVPSAGCRHAFETYVLISRVTGMDEGIYRYLPLENSLVLENSQSMLSEKIIDATFYQSFIGNAAVVFIWTTIPYRMEWRYGLAAHRVIAIDAGHVCQNLYLACEAVDAGTCAIAAFDQKKMDDLINVDGENEFVFYLAPVGKIT